MPSVKPNESESDYVERCIPIVIHEGTAKDGAQASAICHSMYREHHAKKDGKSLILANLASDSQIVTADRFMKSLQLCLGGDGAACSLISKNWDVTIKDAAERLTYTAFEPDDVPLLSGTHLMSKNVGTLSQGSILDFEAIITTTRKDRDGDVLETRGAELDPAAPLLLFHNPDLPIGKVLSKTKHTNDMMAGRFSILDTALGRDAKTLVEGGALRISHGFEPTEFEPLEGVKGGRWHILKLHIMEVSLVSVPSNVDAVILNFSSGKLHTPLMKAWGKSLYDNRPAQGIGFEPVEITERFGDYEVTAKAGSIETAMRAMSMMVGKSKIGESDCSCQSAACAVLEMPADDDQLKAETQFEENQMDEKSNNDAEFPNQGETVDKPGDLERFGGMGSQQGDTGFVSEENESEKMGTAEAGESDATGDVSSGNGVGKDIPAAANKGGRAISAKNRERLMDAKDHLDMVMGMDKTHVSSQAKTLVKAAHSHVSAVCSEPDEDDKGIPESVGFELDPAAYDISKCAAIVLLRMHEIDTDLLFQIAGEADKHLLQAAYEKVSGGA